MAQLPALLQPLGETRRRLDLCRTIAVALCAQLLALGSELNTYQLWFTQPPYQVPYHHFLRALDALADHHDQIEGGPLDGGRHLHPGTASLRRRTGTAGGAGAAG
jgi:hypothetical protein